MYKTKSQRWISPEEFALLKAKALMYMSALYGVASHLDKAKKYLIQSKTMDVNDTDFKS